MTNVGRDRLILGVVEHKLDWSSTSLWEGPEAQTGNSFWGVRWPADFKRARRADDRSSISTREYRALIVNCYTTDWIP